MKDLNIESENKKDSLHLRNLNAGEMLLSVKNNGFDGARVSDIIINTNKAKQIRDGLDQFIKENGG